MAERAALRAASPDARPRAVFAMAARALGKNSRRTQVLLGATYAFKVITTTRDLQNEASQPNCRENQKIEQLRRESACPTPLSSTLRRARGHALSTDSFCPFVVARLLSTSLRGLSIDQTFASLSHGDTEQTTVTNEITGAAT